MSRNGARMEVLVKAIRHEADAVLSLDLRPVAQGDSLPACAAGAHIDLHLGVGLVRSYSLINPEERHRYVVAVRLDSASRGGSRMIHEALRVGTRLTIEGPANNFPLNETASHSVLIAGGIGITPLLGMLARLEALGRSWELHYASRSRASAPFLDVLQQYAATQVDLAFDQEPGGGRLDIAGIVARAGSDAHLYCCGPAPMLSAFEAACVGLPPERVHVEYFSAARMPPTGDGFTVVLKQSGLTLQVLPGETILDKMLAAQVEISYACMEGVCGTCETRVLDGIPDHHDRVLSAAERASGATMMVCCSGCKGSQLVLDC